MAVGLVNKSNSGGQFIFLVTCSVGGLGVFKITEVPQTLRGE